MDAVGPRRGGLLAGPSIGVDHRHCLGKSAVVGGLQRWHPGGDDLEAAPLIEAVKHVVSEHRHRDGGAGDHGTRGQAIDGTVLCRRPLPHLGRYQQPIAVTGWSVDVGDRLAPSGPSPSQPGRPGGWHGGRAGSRGRGSGRWWRWGCHRLGHRRATGGEDERDNQPFHSCVTTPGQIIPSWAARSYAVSGGTGRTRGRSGSRGY